MLDGQFLVAQTNSISDESDVYPRFRISCGGTPNLAASVTTTMTELNKAACYSQTFYSYNGLDNSVNQWQLIRGRYTGSGDLKG